MLADICVLWQMAKVGVALTEGRTGAPTASPMDIQSNGNAADAAPAPKEDTNSVRPQSFKSLVGKGHSEFQSNRQQVCAVLSCCSDPQCWLIATLRIQLPVFVLMTS